MKKPGFDRFDPIIEIHNRSRSVSDRDVKRALPALQKQITDHFAPAWGLHARLVFGVEVPRSMKVVIRDRSDEKGDLGYHFVKGYPVTYVFAEDDLAQYGEITSTLSHELLEMIADPGVNLYAAGFYLVKHGAKSKAWIPYEVCDAVQENLYKIGGVRVSDFLFPEWFEPEHKVGAMKMDQLGVLDRPFQLAPGCYTDAVVGKRYLTVWGRRRRSHKTRHRMAARRAAWIARGA
jgi:hypothetical protein